MAWQVEWSKAADKDIAKLGHIEKQRLIDFIETRVAQLADPRSIGQALTGGKLGHLWRYRMGDYRIIADIQDKVLRVYVVRLGNRREVYR